jgi:hypothetical protein
MQNETPFTDRTVKPEQLFFRWFNVVLLLLLIATGQLVLYRMNHPAAAAPAADRLGELQTAQLTSAQLRRQLDDANADRANLAGLLQAAQGNLELARTREATCEAARQTDARVADARLQTVVQTMQASYRARLLNVEAQAKLLPPSSPAGAVLQMLAKATQPPAAAQP